MKECCNGARVCWTVFKVEPPPSGGDEKFLIQICVSLTSIVHYTIESYTSVSIYQSTTNNVALHNLAIMYIIYLSAYKFHTLLLDYGGQLYLS